MDIERVYAVTVMGAQLEYIVIIFNQFRATIFA